MGVADVDANVDVLFVEDVEEDFFIVIVFIVVVGDDGVVVLRATVLLLLLPSRSANIEGANTVKKNVFGDNENDDKEEEEEDEVNSRVIFETFSITFFKKIFLHKKNEENEEDDKEKYSISYSLFRFAKNNIRFAMKSSMFSFF